ncbi:hypothetical protein O181_094352 [Austropuccinia psidii MF-1]|uniref:Uncharacterized protein n=1 Tax=Austropuccinia psidii MF-1 TaxID=1389203 RepID=A0A9Q3J2S8_9BASI|nr:hypothetical protein [Austropuccinia psidii MF-1]
MKERTLVDNLQTRQEVNEDKKQLCDNLRNLYMKQGKVVRTKGNKEKSFWDKKILNSIIRQSNRARRWFLLKRSEEAKRCYQLLQKNFACKVESLKQNNWRRFLAERGGNHSFNTFKSTISRMLGEAKALRTKEGVLKQDEEEQANLLFEVLSKEG